MNAAWAALFALAAEAPRYPLPQAPPGAAPPPGVSVADVAYSMSDQPRVVQAVAARVRLGDWGFAGASVRNQLRGATLQTHRLDADFAEEGGQYEMGAGFRARRLRVGVRYLKAPEDAPHDAALEAGFRIGLTTEVAGSYLEEGRPRPFPSHPYREAALQLDHQGDQGLELTVRATRATVPTVAGFDFHRHRLAAAAVRGWRAAEVEAQLGYERTLGRLGSNEVFASASLRAPVRGRLLAEGGTRARWEPGVSVFEHEHFGALSLHARRVRLARTGPAAARTIELVREANRQGANLRAAHDDVARRALRERALLAPARDSLRSAVEALHEAQVAERLVPLLGIEVSGGSDHVRGSRSRSYRAFAGAPFPLALPWPHREDAVPFLRLSYLYRETRFDVAPTTVDEEASLEVELNREHRVIGTWSRPGRTPLDLARLTATASSWRVAYAYTRGR